MAIDCFLPLRVRLQFRPGARPVTEAPRFDLPLNCTGVPQVPVDPRVDFDPDDFSDDFA